MLGIDFVCRWLSFEWEGNRQRNPVLVALREEQVPSALTPNIVEVTNLSFTIISTDTDFPSLRVVMEVRHKNPNNRPELEAVAPLTSTASLR